MTRTRGGYLRTALPSVLCIPLFVLLPGCGDDDASATCDREFRQCPCPGGTVGTSSCVDGVYGACVCTDSGLIFDGAVPLDVGPGPDSATTDANTVVDSGPLPVDSGGTDSGPVDSGNELDAGEMDAGPEPDAGEMDAGTDAGMMDAGTDAGMMDTDAGMMDMDSGPDPDSGT